MSFGQNLQFLRKMRNQMTQEELAEKMGVSRQTISKWELDSTYPEIDKIIELCNLFSCTMDQLVREDMNTGDEAYSDIRIEWVSGFRYLRYAVISADPEEDAINHVSAWARKLDIPDPEIIGWDFPVVSQEQTNVFNMHGYMAALILNGDISAADIDTEVHCQDKQQYIALTIRQPSLNPFRLIPNAYQTLLTYMKMNGIKEKWDKAVISCFEKKYIVDDIDYMDIYIALQS